MKIPDQVYQYFYTKKLEITLLLIGFTLIGIGVFLWKAGVTTEKIEISEASGIKAEEKSGSFLVVDVAGAVNNPGVVNLLSGARVADAIASAGGITEKADKNWVSQYLNMAKPVADGEKIYVPAVREDGIITNVQPGTTKININTAGESELDKLPGIGPVTAAGIIKNRPYAKIEELKEKKVVTAKVWEQIKDLISTW